MGARAQLMISRRELRHLPHLRASTMAAALWVLCYLSRHRARLNNAVIISFGDLQ
jgi:hypothetical protein